MRFHILGLGPVGTLLAYHLRNSLPKEASITLVFKSFRQSLLARQNKGTIRCSRDGVNSAASGFESEIFEGSLAERAKIISTTKKENANTGAEPTKMLKERILPRVTKRSLDPIETLFISTKAPATLPAVQSLLPRLSDHSTIVLFQNGLGIYEQLIQQVFRNPQTRPHFILASNTHGAYLSSMFNVIHTGLGEIEFGIAPDPYGRDFEAGLNDTSVPKLDRKLKIDDIAPESITSDLDRYRSLRNTVAALSRLNDLDASWKSLSDVHISMRRKLVVNAVINPLTALMGCRNGEIFLTKSSLRIMYRVCQEAADVFQAQIKKETEEWIEKMSQGNLQVKDSLPVGRIPYVLTRRPLADQCVRVAKRTGGNISSMLSDVRSGKKTEIDYINGYLLNLGATHRIPMPATAMLLNLIKMRCAIPLDQLL